MKMSIVIVAYKNQDVLLKCLNSINQYNDLQDELEVIVVDNSPIDERVEKILWESLLKNVRYIPANNSGFGAGNNIGARAATGEIIGFLNPDVILIEPIFSQIYKDFKRDVTLALEGIKLLYEDLTSGFSFYYDYNTKIWRNWTIKVWNRLNRFDEKRMFISGANLFVRSSVFFEIGMFDENIFMYYEEPELIRRIKGLNRGLRIGFNKNLKMIHLEKKCTPASPKMIGIAWDSAIYYGKKHNLNYRKKLAFEYRYYSMKRNIMKKLDADKYEELNELIIYLDNNYRDYLS